MITGLYAGILALIYIALSLNVVRCRRKHRVSLGDKDIPEMLAAIRIHGNFIEYVPFALILMFLTETPHNNLLLVNIAGVMLIVARLLHIYAIGKRAAGPRIAGMMLTFAVLGVLGVFLILRSSGAIL
jgi:uncharacterized membrane protein YecN with MAPEG domain